MNLLTEDSTPEEIERDELDYFNSVNNLIDKNFDIESDEFDCPIAGQNQAKNSEKLSKFVDTNDHNQQVPDIKRSINSDSSVVPSNEPIQGSNQESKPKNQAESDKTSQSGNSFEPITQTLPSSVWDSSLGSKKTFPDSPDNQNSLLKPIPSSLKPIRNSNQTFTGPRKEIKDKIQELKKSLEVLNKFPKKQNVGFERTLLDKIILILTILIIINLILAVSVSYLKYNEYRKQLRKNLTDLISNNTQEEDFSNEKELLVSNEDMLWFNIGDRAFNLSRGSLRNNPHSYLWELSDKHKNYQAFWIARHSEPFVPIYSYLIYGDIDDYNQSNLKLDHVISEANFYKINPEFTEMIKNPKKKEETKARRKGSFSKLVKTILKIFA